MIIERKILQASTFVFVGNWNIFFVNFCMDEFDMKGIFPLIVFLPYFFSIVAMYFLFYDYFFEKVKKIQNKISRFMLSIILVISILFTGITLQTGIYYVWLILL